MVPSLQLLETKRRVEAQLLAKSGVTGVDIGYKEISGRPTMILAIRVLVKKKGPVPKGEEIPREIEGYPTDVIERRFEIHADTTLYNPIVGGASIGPCRLVDFNTYTGTLGYLVKDRASGDKMILSNFHILCIDNSCSVGDSITQPSLIDTGFCPDDVIATLTRWHLGGSMDCAVATLSTDRDSKPEVADVGEVSGQATVGLGDTVKKRGRTSGLKYGTVDAVDLSSTTFYPGIGNVTLTGQIGIAPVEGDIFGTHGDSGSLVLDHRRRAVGLYYAGSDTGYGVANPIADVLEQLEVDLWLGEPAGDFVNYPLSLPLPLLDFGGGPLHATVASDLSSAKIERRLRFKGSPAYLSVDWAFGINQYQAFKGFFASDIDQGAALFTIPLRFPRNSELKEWIVRFQGGYEATNQEGVWQVKAQLLLVRPSLAGQVIALPKDRGNFLVLPDGNPFIVVDHQPFIVITIGAFVPLHSTSFILSDHKPLQVGL